MHALVASGWTSSERAGREGVGRGRTESQSVVGSVTGAWCFAYRIDTIFGTALMSLKKRERSNFMGQCSAPERDNSTA